MLPLLFRVLLLLLLLLQALPKEVGFFTFNCVAVAAAAAAGCSKTIR